MTIPSSLCKLEPLSGVTILVNVCAQDQQTCLKQECIPVGCVPAARRPYAGVCFPGGSAWFGGCLPGLGGLPGPGGCLPGHGGSAWSRGFTWPGGCLPSQGAACLVWGVPSWSRGVPPCPGGLVSQHALRQNPPCEQNDRQV